MTTIQAVVQAVAEQFQPEKIILFGSYAYGQPQPWSDVDLLVVMDTALTPREQRLQISRQLYHHPFRLDILVRTPADLAHRLAEGDFFLLEITRKGRVLYEKPDR